MNIEDTNRELLQRLKDAQPVRGTFPPVYMVDGVLIGYDRLEQIRVIAETRQEPEQHQSRWAHPFETMLHAFARARMKLAAISGHSAYFASKN